MNLYRISFMAILLIIFVAIFAYLFYQIYVFWNSVKKVAEEHDRKNQEEAELRRLLINGLKNDALGEKNEVHIHADNVHCQDFIDNHGTINYQENNNNK